MWSTEDYADGLSLHEEVTNTCCFVKCRLRKKDDRNRILRQRGQEAIMKELDLVRFVKQQKMVRALIKAVLDKDEQRLSKLFRF